MRIWFAPAIFLCAILIIPALWIGCSEDDDDDDDSEFDDDDQSDDDDDAVDDDDLPDDDDDDSASTELTWIKIPAGTFEMGCSPEDEICGFDEKPRHPVNMSAFEILQTEVTQNQYLETIGSNPSEQDDCEHCPVENVTWQQAKEFCEALGGRMPTEAEWEYAARGGMASRIYCDEDVEEDCLEDIAWYFDNSDDRPHPAGDKAPNKFGLYDTLGNVWEWTADWYEEEFYNQVPEGGWNDPAGPLEGETKVVRGGSWKYENADGDYGVYLLRVSFRFELDPTHAGGDLGFRCVR